MPRRAFQQTFKQSVLSHFIFLLLTAGAMGGLIWLILTERVPGWLWCPVAFLFLMLLMVIGSVRAALRPTNWLVKFDGLTLYIKFRSYLNHHFPADDPAVIELDTNDVQFVRKTKLQTTTPDTHASSSTAETWTFLDLKLKHTDTAPLEEALKTERGAVAPKVGISRTKALHYPVRLVEPGLIRLAWKGPSDRIKPSIKTALRVLGSAIPIEHVLSPEKKQWDQLEGRELEDFIIELCESGRTIKAAKVLRLRYGYNLTEAKKFISELIGQTPPKATEP